MRRNCLLTLLLPGVIFLLPACTPGTITPVIQTPTPHASPSTIATQTQTALPPTSTPSPSPTVSATPAPLSTATPTPSPTDIYQNAFAVDFSADGRILAFNSAIDGLVPEDQNQVTDAFLYQTVDGTIQRVRMDQESPTSDIPAPASSLSANGRYLLYGARANAPEPAADHYNFTLLRDLETGQDERIDFVPLEKQLAVSSIRAGLSPDGRYLALEAVMDNWNIVLLERATGKITPVTELPDGSLPDGNSYGPVFSPDGRFLAFVSDAHNLVAGDERCSEDNPNCGDVFVYDITTGKLERIPAKLRFTMGNPYPYLTVSTSARFLAWTELEDVEIHFRPVIRLFDRQTGQLETACAGEGFCSGHSPSISNDGRWLAFASITGITDQGQWDSTKPGQVFLLDRQTGQQVLVSAADGQPGDGRSGMIQLQSEGFSSDVRISGDGRFVAFSSQAANLLPPGVEKRQCFDPIIIGAYPCYDLFVYDHQAGTLNWISQPG